jgi:lipopolysaccharide export system permease protein
MGVSVLLLILVQMIHTWASGASLRSDTSWPLVYVAPVAGVGIAALLLWLSQRPRRLPRQIAGAAT